MDPTLSESLKNKGVILCQQPGDTSVRYYRLRLLSSCEFEATKTTLLMNDGRLWGKTRLTKAKMVVTPLWKFLAPVGCGPPVPTRDTEELEAVRITYRVLERVSYIW